MPEEVMIVLVTGMVVGIPVLGLTIRMVARPMAEAIATLKDSFVGSRHPHYDSMESQRLLALEDEVDSLRQLVGRLAEAEDFRQALIAPSPPNTPGLPSTTDDNKSST